MTAGVEDRTSEVLAGEDPRPDSEPGSVLEVLELLEDAVRVHQEYVALVESLAAPDGVLRALRSLSPEDQSAVLAHEDVAARRDMSSQAVLAIHNQALGLVCGHLMEAGGLELETLREALGPYFRDPVLPGSSAPGDPSASPI